MTFFRIVQSDHEPIPVNSANEEFWMGVYETRAEAEAAIERFRESFKRALRECPYHIQEVWLNF